MAKMKKKIIDPDYISELISMERDFKSTSHIINALERDRLNGLVENSLPFATTFKKPDSQTENLTNILVSVALELKHDHLLKHLPQVGPDEASSRALTLITDPIKKFDSRNHFGSEWNRLTALIAARRLGLPEQKIGNLIENKGQVGIKLRNTQALVSKELEANFISHLKNNPSRLTQIISIETWINGLVEEFRQKLNSQIHDLSKSRKENILQNSITAFINILNFAPNQDLPLGHLKDILLSAQVDTPINLVVLHCLSFKNDPVKGIEVCTSPEDFIATNADGTKVQITQNDSLDKVANFIQILKTSGTKFDLCFLVVDTDAFVPEHQENNISSFINGLNETILSHPSIKQRFTITKTSDLINPNDFDNEWIRLNESQQERLVDEEFQKVQRRTLPASLKTREFARKLARKNFITQLSMGILIPLIFPNSITLQRARAHQQAIRIFNNGAKLIGATPVIITHWKDMTRIE